MAAAVAAAAANAVATARAVKSAVPKGPTIKPARGVTAALVGSLIVVGIGEIRQAPGPGNVLDPRPFIATFGVFIIIGFIAEINPAFGRMLAVLAFVAILLARGEGALDGLLEPSKKKKKKQRTVEITTV